MLFYTDWTVESLRKGFAAPEKLFFILTNSRGFTVAETTKAFTEHCGNYGYAFAQVEAVPEVDRVNNRVAITLRSEPSRRAYVRRINIQGNTRTRDEVIRREFRQYESS